MNTQTYSIHICLGHETFFRTTAKTPAEARAQARIYMQMLCPLAAWQEDSSDPTGPDPINMTSACVKDTHGFYLLSVDVYPRMPRALV